MGLSARVGTVRLRDNYESVLPASCLRSQPENELDGDQRKLADRSPQRRRRTVFVDGARSSAFAAGVHIPDWTSLEAVLT